MQIAAMSMVSWRTHVLSPSAAPCRLSSCPARDPAVISSCLSSPVTNAAVLHTHVALVDHERRATSGSCNAGMPRHLLHLPASRSRSRELSIAAYYCGLPELAAAATQLHVNVVHVAAIGIGTPISCSFPCDFPLLTSCRGTYPAVSAPGAGDDGNHHVLLQLLRLSPPCGRCCRTRCCACVLAALAAAAAL